MQYIECIYCGKRYPANQKLRDAMGKSKVRCTNCGQSFPVVVYEVRNTKKPARGSRSEKRDDTAGD